MVHVGMVFFLYKYLTINNTILSFSVVIISNPQFFQSEIYDGWNVRPILVILNKRHFTKLHH